MWLETLGTWTWKVQTGWPLSRGLLWRILRRWFVLLEKLEAAPLMCDARYSLSVYKLFP